MFRKPPQSIQESAATTRLFDIVQEPDATEPTTSAVLRGGGGQAPHVGQRSTLVRRRKVSHWVDLDGINHNYYAPVASAVLTSFPVAGRAQQVAYLSDGWIWILCFAPLTCGNTNVYEQSVPYDKQVVN